MKQHFIKGWLIRLHYSKEGWWITDVAGNKNYLKLSIGKCVSPEGLMFTRIVVGGINIEIGKT